MAPFHHIRPAKERAVPQFQVRGTNDKLVRHEDAQEFLDALVAAGQRAEYIQVGGAGHGVYYSALMKTFFESTLY